MDQYPDALPLLRKAAGHTFYFSADAQKQFNSFGLHEDAQEMTTFWTPLGLMKFARLIMGAKNSSTIAQAIYTRFMTTYLPQATQRAMVNFQDDFVGFADNGDELVEHFARFLKMCLETGVKLNPAKVCVGVREVKFYGYKLSKKGLHPAEGNLDPIKKLTAPTNRSEVRSLLGLFVQFRQFFERYDRIVKPIQKLLHKNVAFEWGPEQEQALATLKAHITKPGVYLAVPHKDLPLILETDGSDDGWGAILLQVVDGERRVIAMWGKQWSTIGMQKAPPYYKETKAWMNGMEKARIYIDAHPLPVICVTDHIPLTWIKHTSGKGPVSQFILDNLGKLDYELKYRPGSQLVEADAVSRYPCLGPKTLSTGGMKEAVETVLRVLPKTWDVQGRIWVNTGKTTMLIRELVHNYQQQLPSKGARRVPLTERATEQRIQQMNYGLAILAPPADKCTKLLSEALRKDKPFAMLIPLSLLHLTPGGNAVKTKLKNAAKHVLTQPELVWIIHKVPGVTSCQVHRRQIPYFGPEPDMIGILEGPPAFDIKDWPAKQKQFVEENAKEYDGKT